MGQAKNRGTREQRIEQALERKIRIATHTRSRIEREGKRRQEQYQVLCQVAEYLEGQRKI